MSETTFVSTVQGQAHELHDILVRCLATVRSLHDSSVVIPGAFDTIPADTAECLLGKNIEIAGALWDEVDQLKETQ